MAQVVGRKTNRALVERDYILKIIIMGVDDLKSMYVSLFFITQSSHLFYVCIALRPTQSNII